MHEGIFSKTSSSQTSICISPECGRVTINCFTYNTFRLETVLMYDAYFLGETGGEQTLSGAELEPIVALHVEG